MYKDGKNKIIKLILCIILIIPLFSNNILAESNNIINVDNDGNYDSILIQDAIDKASNGDIIHIYSGTYNEDIIINKSLTIIGENKTNSIINGKNNVIQIFSDNVIVENLTIKKGLNGIYIINSSNCIITENNIIDNKIGINIDNQSRDNLIYNNNFINNTYNAYDNGNNNWYNIRNRGGNYWDDYDEPNEGAYDYDNDGIVDEPYKLIIGLNNDKYPKIMPISIKPYCNFSYSPNQIYTYDIVTFNDTSYDQDGYIINWFWDFGDGKTSDLRNPKYEYKNDGVYNVTLEITDNYGITNKSIKKLIVNNSKPIVKFHILPIQPNDVDNVYFYDESYDKDGGIVRWEWDFGDGILLLDPENPLEITHKYDDNGAYNVTLRVYDNDNLMNQTSIEINVLNVKPSAKFYFKPLNTSNLVILKKQEVKFVDTSVDLDGEIVKYNWDFGDNSLSNKTNPIHVYNKSGTYEVSLTVYDNDGESDIYNLKITVLSEYNPPNKISFPTGMSLAVILIIIMIVILVLISIKLGKKI